MSLEVENIKNISLKFPFKFNQRKLSKDLNICLAQKWKSHFNSSNYSGSWKVVSLRSPDGKEESIFANSNTNYQNTNLLKNCTYFNQVLNCFECEKEAVRLLRLDPLSEIKLHTDYKLGYEDGIFRVHVPILTNEKVDFIVGETKVEMEVGTCWYANFNLPHKVINRGTSPRIHLVFDCVRNSWSDKLFEQMNYDFSFEKEKSANHIKKEDIPKIIDQLKMLDTDASRALIKDLEGKV